MWIEHTSFRIKGEIITSIRWKGTSTHTFSCSFFCLSSSFTSLSFSFLSNRFAFFFSFCFRSFSSSSCCVRGGGTWAPFQSYLEGFKYNIYILHTIVIHFLYTAIYQAVTGVLWLVSILTFHRSLVSILTSHWSLVSILTSHWSLVSILTANWSLVSILTSG